MIAVSNRLGARPASVAAGAFAALLLSLSVASAQAPIPTEGQIADALMPKPMTRSLSTGAPAQPRTAVAEEAAFIDSLRSPPTRSLSVGQRDRLATIADGKPTVDLDIPFALNSATISAKARPVVDALGAALTRPALKEGTFMIAGHTDARGGEALNQGLSERRAASVKRYLVEKFKLPPKNLITAGYGKSRLKNKEQPLADENRRVQTSNLTDVQSASR